MNEERTLPRAILIVILAIVIPAAVVAAYVWANHVPTPYKGQILSLNVYPIHHDYTQPTTPNGIGGQTETYDEILIFAYVRVENVSKIPLFLQDMWAVVDIPDQTDRSTAVSQSDFDKVFIAYPNLKQFEKAPLPRDLTLQPGQKADGLMIFHYQITQAQWESATSMKINIAFRHHPPLVMETK
ncbi:MAG TPA: hypothetical protein VFW25_15275 [Silvibacterium sp.]|nr:hypothetical protein [Silvibacterium sp.]